MWFWRQHGYFLRCTVIGGFQILRDQGKKFQANRGIVPSEKDERVTAHHFHTQKHLVFINQKYTKGTPEDYIIYMDSLDKLCSQNYCPSHMLIGSFWGQFNEIFVAEGFASHSSYYGSFLADKSISDYCSDPRSQYCTIF